MKKIEEIADLFCYGVTKTPQIGDVAMIKVGANTGKKIFVVTNENIGIVTKNCIGIRCKDTSNAQKLCEYLLSEKCQAEIAQHIKGATMLSISLVSIKELMVEI